MNGPDVRIAPARWLITGVAGFIGSNLLEHLLRHGHQVRGLDNFATGHRHNLEQVAREVGDAAWRRFELIEGDLCRSDDCRAAVGGVDYVLHQAALGSVPRSIDRPLDSFASNVEGFVKMLDAARHARVRRFVYAASSSTYGDSAELPKVEERIGRPLSPYAATKLIDEVIADTYARTYGISCMGLRYFNVFGPRQDPAGAYAAVIPRWIAALIRGEPVYINGDGQTSRDFCYVANAVQANLRAAVADGLAGPHEVFNIAVGRRTTLAELFELIRQALVRAGIDCATARPVHRDFRQGDVRHSLADVGKAGRLLGYAPTHTVASGLAESIGWYVANTRVG